MDFRKELTIMYKYKVNIEYDGSKYKGWQRLAGTEKTVQQKIETLLSRLLERKIEIHGSGRTDAGVHAYQQVAHFAINQQLDTDRFLSTINEMLPQDIVFTSIQEVPEDFHARLSVKSKQYVYKIWSSPIPSALRRKYFFHVSMPLNIPEMKRAADYLIGTHDFQSFTAVKAKNKSTVRTIFAIDIKSNNEELEIHYHGDGFLYKMVRIITGTLLEVGLGQMTPEEVLAILKKKERRFAGETVPGYGLYLYKVKYE